MASFLRRRQRVFVSDIDGTLLDDDRPTPGLARLRRTIERRRPRVRVVYATGRTFPMTWAHVASGELARPDAVVTLVGTELWLPPWRGPDPGYARYLGEGWRREAVIEALSDLPQLELQPATFQGPTKVSYFMLDPSLLPEVERRIATCCRHAQVVYSGGRFLDVIPRRAGKAGAVRYLLRRWDLPRAEVLAAGDSANDLDLLAAPDVLGVAVGNADPELQDLGVDETVHLARRRFAAGVVEGLTALDFLPADDLS